MLSHSVLVLSLPVLFTCLELVLINFIVSLYMILSTAIATVVTVAEILKNNGLAVEKSELLSSFPFVFPVLLCRMVEQSNLIDGGMLM